MSPTTMSSTRRSQMVEVYQDPDASFNMSQMSDVDTRLLNALNPLNDASNKQNITLNPTSSNTKGSSPTKTDSSPGRPMSAHSLRDINLPPPRQPKFNTESPRKHTGFYQGPALGPIPTPETASLSAQFSADHYELGNFDRSSFTPIAPLPYEDLGYSFKAPGKRLLSDDTASSDKSGLKKPKIEEQELFELPDPSEMPTVVDDGTKPPHSYATLIGMAILRASNRRLTLASIYKWISDNFAFYRVAESGWQNSIRHNLSLNKNFIKQERPKDDPGKGNYWAIKPGQERTFLVDKKNQVRRITNPDGSQYIHGLPGDIGPLRSSNGPAIGHFTLAPNPHRRSESKGIDSAKFPEEPAFSSDGTIPGSDPAMHEDDSINISNHRSTDMGPPPAHLRSSPPPQDIGSSPPQIERKATPPPVPRFPSTSRSGGRKRKFQGLNDSGYWSSIESSAARNAAHVLTSEADIARPRIRKGRAEAEIARIRSSSFDSPSKDKRGVALQYQQSSPLKEDSPLTPAVAFKRPQKPPPSVSPNTNLRNHRDRLKALLASPAKTFSPLPPLESSNWSPAFNVSADDSMIAGLTPFFSPYKFRQTPWKSDTPGAQNKLFDVFVDAPEEDLTARGSPEKRSARRPSLVRAATSSGILADVTGSARTNLSSAPGLLGNGNNNTESPFSFSPFLLKTAQGTPSLRSPARLGSPLKQMHKPSLSQPAAGTGAFSTGLDWFQDENLQPDRSLSKDEAAQLFGVDLPSDGSEEGIDLFQDFGKIGAAAGGNLGGHAAVDRSTGSPVRKASSSVGGSRPILGRSITSRW